MRACVRRSRATRSIVSVAALFTFFRNPGHPKAIDTKGWMLTPGAPKSANVKAACEPNNYSITSDKKSHRDGGQQSNSETRVKANPHGN